MKEFFTNLGRSVYNIAPNLVASELGNITSSIQTFNSFKDYVEKSTLESANNDLNKFFRDEFGEQIDNLQTGKFIDDLTKGKLIRSDEELEEEMMSSMGLDMDGFDSLDVDGIDTSSVTDGDMANVSATLASGSNVVDSIKGLSKLSARGSDKITQGITRTGTTQIKLGIQTNSLIGDLKTAVVTTMGSLKSSLENIESKLSNITDIMSVMTSTSFMHKDERQMRSLVDEDGRFNYRGWFNNIKDKIPFLPMSLSSMMSETATSMVGDRFFETSAGKLIKDVNKIIPNAPFIADNYFKNMSRDNPDNGILKGLVDFFGIEYSTQKLNSLDINPLEEEGMNIKRAVAFDQETKMSIVETIPGLLAKIITAVKGGTKDDDLIKDTETGRFVTRKKIRERYENRFDNIIEDHLDKDTDGVLYGIKERSGASTSDVLNRLSSFTTEDISKYVDRFHLSSDNVLKEIGQTYNSLSSGNKMMFMRNLLTMNDTATATKREIFGSQNYDGSTHRIMLDDLDKKNDSGQVIKFNDFLEDIHSNKSPIRTANDIDDARNRFRRLKESIERSESTTEFKKSFTDETEEMNYIQRQMNKYVRNANNTLVTGGLTETQEERISSIPASKIRRVIDRVKLTDPKAAAEIHKIRSGSKHYKYIIKELGLELGDDLGFLKPYSKGHTDLQHNDHRTDMSADIRKDISSKYQDISESDTFIGKYILKPINELVAPAITETKKIATDSFKYIRNIIVDDIAKPTVRGIFGQDITKKDGVEQGFIGTMSNIFTKTFETIKEKTVGKEGVFTRIYRFFAPEKDTDHLKDFKSFITSSYDTIKENIHKFLIEPVKKFFVDLSDNFKKYIYTPVHSFLIGDDDKPGILRSTFNTFRKKILIPAGNLIKDTTSYIKKGFVDNVWTPFKYHLFDPQHGLFGEKSRKSLYSDVWKPFKDNILEAGGRISESFKDSFKSPKFTFVEQIANAVDTKLIEPAKNFLFGDGAKTGIFTNIGNSIQDNVLRPFKNFMIGEDGKGGIIGSTVTSVRYFLFGQDGEGGFVRKYINPFVNYVTDKIIIPLKDGIVATYNQFKDIFKEHLIDPLRKSLDGFMTSFNNSFKRFLDYGKDMLVSVYDKAASGISSIISGSSQHSIVGIIESKIIEPMKELMGISRDVFMKITKSTFGLVTGLVGNITDKFKVNDILAGTAGHLSKEDFNRLVKTHKLKGVKKYEDNRDTRSNTYRIDSATGDVIVEEKKKGYLGKLLENRKKKKEEAALKKHKEDNFKVKIYDDTEKIKKNTDNLNDIKDTSKKTSDTLERIKQIVSNLKGEKNSEIIIDAHDDNKEHINKQNEKLDEIAKINTDNNLLMETNLVQINTNTARTNDILMNMYRFLKGDSNIISGLKGGGRGTGLIGHTMNIIGTMANTVASIPGVLLEGVKHAFKPVMSILDGVVKATTSLVSSTITALGQIPNMLATVAKPLLAMTAMTLGTIGKASVKAIEASGKIISKTIDVAGGVLSKGIDGIVSVTSMVAGSVVEIVKNSDKIVSSVTKLIASVADIAMKTLHTGLSIVGSGLSGVADIILGKRKASLSKVYVVGGQLDHVGGLGDGSKGISSFEDHEKDLNDKRIRTRVGNVFKAIASPISGLVNKITEKNNTDSKKDTEINNNLSSFVETIKERSSGIQKVYLSGGSVDNISNLEGEGSKYKKPTLDDMQNKEPEKLIRKYKVDLTRPSKKASDEINEQKSKEEEEKALIERDNRKKSVKESLERSRLEGHETQEERDAKKIERRQQKSIISGNHSSGSNEKVIEQLQNLRRENQESLNISNMISMAQLGVLFAQLAAKGANALGSLASWMGGLRNPSGRAALFSRIRGVVSSRSGRLGIGLTAGYGIHKMGQSLADSTGIEEVGTIGTVLGGVVAGATTGSMAGAPGALVGAVLGGLGGLYYAKQEEVDTRVRDIFIGTKSLSEESIERRVKEGEDRESLIRMKEFNEREMTFKDKLLYSMFGNNEIYDEEGDLLYEAKKGIIGRLVDITTRDAKVVADFGKKIIGKTSEAFGIWVDSVKEDIQMAWNNVKKNVDQGIDHTVISSVAWVDSWSVTEAGRFLGLVDDNRIFAINGKTFLVKEEKIDALIEWYKESKKSKYPYKIMREVYQRMVEEDHIDEGYLFSGSINISASELSLVISPEDTLKLLWYAIQTKADGRGKLSDRSIYKLYALRQYYIVEGVASGVDNGKSWVKGRGIVQDKKLVEKNVMYDNKTISEIAKKPIINDGDDHTDKYSPSKEDLELTDASNYQFDDSNKDSKPKNVFKNDRELAAFLSGKGGVLNSPGDKVFTGNEVVSGISNQHIETVQQPEPQKISGTDDIIIYDDNVDFGDNVSPEIQCKRILTRIRAKSDTESMMFSPSPVAQTSILENVFTESLPIERSEVDQYAEMDVVNVPDVSEYVDNSTQLESSESSIVNNTNNITDRIVNDNIVNNDNNVNNETITHNKSVKDLITNNTVYDSSSSSTTNSNTVNSVKEELTKEEVEKPEMSQVENTSIKDDIVKSIPTNDYQMPNLFHTNGTESNVATPTYNMPNAFSSSQSMPNGFNNYSNEGTGEASHTTINLLQPESNVNTNNMPLYRTISNNSVYNNSIRNTDGRMTNERFNNYLEDRYYNHTSNYNPKAGVDRIHNDKSVVMNHVIDKIKQIKAIENKTSVTNNNKQSTNDNTVNTVTKKVDKAFSMSVSGFSNSLLGKTDDKEEDQKSNITVDDTIHQHKPIMMGGGINPNVDDTEIPEVKDYTIQCDNGKMSGYIDRKAPPSIYIPNSPTQKPTVQRIPQKVDIDPSIKEEIKRIEKNKSKGIDPYAPEKPTNTNIDSSSSSATTTTNNNSVNRFNTFNRVGADVEKYKKVKIERKRGNLEFDPKLKKERDSGGKYRHLRLIKGKIQGMPDIKGLHPQTREKLLLMAKEYYNTYGTKLPITTGYRSLKHQKALYYNPRYHAARPGTSDHGLGLAIDVSGASHQKRLRKIALKYGFYQSYWNPSNGRGRMHFDDVASRINIDNKSVRGGRIKGLGSIQLAIRRKYPGDESKLRNGAWEKYATGSRARKLIENMEKLDGKVAMKPEDKNSDIEVERREDVNVDAEYNKKSHNPDYHHPKGMLPFTASIVRKRDDNEMNVKSTAEKLAEDNAKKLMSGEIGDGGTQTPSSSNAESKAVEKLASIPKPVNVKEEPTQSNIKVNTDSKDTQSLVKIQSQSLKILNNIAGLLGMNINEQQVVKKEQQKMDNEFQRMFPRDINNISTESFDTRYIGKGVDHVTRADAIEIVTGG